MYRLLAVLCCFLALQSVAQNEHELYDEAVVLRNRQMYGGVHLHSGGLGGFFNVGKYENANTVRFIGIDVLYMKHEKEVKSFNPIYEDSRSYVYGKMNNFYIFRPSVGVKKMISPKLRKSGVEVGYTLQFGPSLGITKPVYLEIGYPSIPYEYLAVEQYDPERHFFDDIFGKASGFNGLNQLKLHPGGFVKFAFNFEYSNEKDLMKGMEAGVVLDVYAQRVPIMANTESFEDRNKALFLNFYLNLFIGKKYNVNR
ncbi:MAG: hypothetical protein P8L71_03535 [Flavobacteriales bacterium]|nr:hypothetical protein [Flavobacteriales bacterium]